MAHVFNKGGADKTVVLDVRQQLVQPFEAGQWLDLRVGWLLSITKATNDDDVTGLAEDIGVDDLLHYLAFTDRYQIGLTDRATGTTFCGYTNLGQVRPMTDLLSTGRSRLVSSDLGTGTTNSNFWRPSNGGRPAAAASITDGQVVLASVNSDGSQQHMVQNVAGAGGYATLLMMRLTRTNPTRITVQLPMMGPASADVLFTSSPTSTLLINNLQSFPATVRTLGPVTLSHEPSAISLYWPWRNSKLRIHAMGILVAT
jgi:hypothetical protein